MQVEREVMKGSLTQNIEKATKKYTLSTKPKYIVIADADEMSNG